jgi:hypothetical protein
MLRIRIVSTAAAIAVVLAAGAAAAQTATGDQTGKPLSLLELIKQTSTTTVAANVATTAARKTKIKKIASKKHSKTAQDADQSADAAQSSASAGAWLAASAAPANSAPASPATDVAPSGETAPSDNAHPDDGPGTITIGGQAVQVASADQVNEIDLAADTAPPAESTAPPSDRADVVAANAAPAAAQAAFIASPPADLSQNANSENADAQDASAIGTASWIAQVLAALGGAIAAGAVAWFLIGAGPARTYG